MQARPISAAMSEGLQAEDYRTLATFRRELRRFLAFSAASAEAAGLTPRQHQALLAIKGAPAGEPVSVGALAEALLVRQHSATELTDRLCEAGLLLRAPDPLDRRRVLLTLTPSAEAVLRRLSEAHLAELAALRPALAALLERLGDATERKPDQSSRVSGRS